MSGGAGAGQGQFFKLKVAPEFQFLPGRGLGHIFASHLFQDHLKSLQG
jgi:hypothetical protein